MHIGFHVAADDPAQMKMLKTQIPRAEVVRVFPAGMPWATTVTPAQVVQHLKDVCDPVVALGMIPFWEVKWQPADVISGKVDAHLQAVSKWALALPDGSYGTYWHEPESKLTASAWLPAYVKVDDVLAAASNVQFGPVYEGYAWRNGPLKGWIPGVSDYDFLGFDTYTSDWSGNTIDLSHKSDFLNWLKAIPTAAHIMLVERGVSNGSKLPIPNALDSQAKVIKADLAYLSSLFNPVKGYLYWHSGGGTDGTSDYLLNQQSATVLAAAALKENPIPVVPPVPVVAPPAGGQTTPDGTPYWKVGQALYSDTDVVECGRCWAYVPEDRMPDHGDLMHSTDG